METIFDHNITKKEMKDVMGFDDWTLNDFKDWNQRDHYGLIYRLYVYRGNNKKAQEYADKIPDDIHKLFGTCYHDFTEACFLK